MRFSQPMSFTGDDSMVASPLAECGMAIATLRAQLERRECAKFGAQYRPWFSRDANHCFGGCRVAQRLSRRRAAVYRRSERYVVVFAAR